MANQSPQNRPNGNNNNNDNRNGDRRRFSILTILIIAVAVTLLFNSLLSNVFSAGEKQVTYDAFLSAVETDAISQVEIQSDRIQFLRRDEMALSKSQRTVYYTGLLPNVDLTSLISTLEDNQVEFSGEIVENSTFTFLFSWVLFPLLMLALLAFGGFALWQDAALRRGAFVGAELLQYKPAAPAADNPTLAELQTVNPDVCGWLTVDGTGIDYPVVQGATNMDYVNRDVYGDFSLSGAIFLDSRCAADLTDPYTVIYGHHMDNSAMFGDVTRFAEADYFAAHPAGSISLPDAAYTIELFACVVTDAYDIAINTPERYHDDVGALLDYAAAQAVQQRDIGVTAQDRLVALSTCAGSETNGRVVVLGRLCPLKEGDEMQ